MVASHATLAVLRGRDGVFVGLYTDETPRVAPYGVTQRAFNTATSRPHRVANSSSAPVMCRGVASYYHSISMLIIASSVCASPSSRCWTASPPAAAARLNKRVIRANNLNGIKSLTRYHGHKSWILLIIARTTEPLFVLSTLKYGHPEATFLTVCLSPASLHFYQDTVSSGSSSDVSTTLCDSGYTITHLY